VFYADPRKEKSDYVLTLIGYMIERECFYSAVRTEYLNVSEEILVL